ncbi:MAG: hypothetical protein IKF97_00550 [Clostridia bacterium]|nr:hypothetical protein [Clostridia bacterium]
MKRKQIILGIILIVLVAILVIIGISFAQKPENKITENKSDSSIKTSETVKENKDKNKTEEIVKENNKTEEISTEKINDEEIKKENTNSEEINIDNTIVQNDIAEEINKAYTTDEQKNQRLEFERKFNEAVNNLDRAVFLVDIENYNPQSNEITISETEAKKIAQKGFEESARRIAGEGADNKESETIRIDEKSPNNYFTRYIYDGDKMYTNIKRNCYIITRENEMGNGISIYVDATTGLIIGGNAFGD